MGRVKEIIKEMKGNDYRSFDEFYSMTSKLVYYVIAGIIKNKQTIEDLMQDTYLKFIQNINNVNPNQNPNSYLAQIAKNLAINEFNKSKRVIVDDAYFTNLKDHHTDGGRGIDLGIIDYLIGIEKEVVILKLIGELKFREIAVMLDKPIGTIQWVYNNAIKRLREKVGEENE